MISKIKFFIASFFKDFFVWNGCLSKGTFILKTVLLTVFLYLTYTSLENIFKHSQYQYDFFAYIVPVFVLITIYCFSSLIHKVLTVFGLPSLLYTILTVIIYFILMIIVWILTSIIFIFPLALHSISPLSSDIIMFVLWCSLICVITDILLFNDWTSSIFNRIAKKHKC